LHEMGQHRSVDGPLSERDPRPRHGLEVPAPAPRDVCSGE